MRFPYDLLSAMTDYFTMRSLFCFLLGLARADRETIQTVSQVPICVIVGKMGKGLASEMQNERSLYAKAEQEINGFIELMQRFTDGQVEQSLLISEADRLALTWIHSFSNASCG